MNKRQGLSFLMAAMMFCLSACGKETPSSITDNTLIISKDHQLTSVFVDIFDREYYSDEGLKSLVDAEISEYNQEVSAQKISFNRIEHEDGNVVKLYLDYEDGQAFADYNETTFFMGTVGEAYDKGFDLDVQMISLDGKKAIGKDEILEMDKKKILILGESYYLQLPSAVMYMSEGVFATGKKQEVIANCDQGLVYIIYK